MNIKVVLNTKNDLISRSELKKEFNIIASNSAIGEWQLIPIKHIKQIIDNAPTVELQKSEYSLNIEMTEEDFKKFKEEMNKANRQLYTITSDTFVEGSSSRPQGEWINEYYDDGWFHTCNICKEELKATGSDNFCPNCGADMRKGGTE